MGSLAISFLVGASRGELPEMWDSQVAAVEKPDVMINWRCCFGNILVYLVNDWMLFLFCEK